MNISAQDVKDMRERTGFGMMTCKSILVRERLHEVVREATTVEELRDLLHILVEHNQVVPQW